MACSGFRKMSWDAKWASLVTRQLRLVFKRRAWGVYGGWLKTLKKRALTTLPAGFQGEESEDEVNEK